MLQRVEVQLRALGDELGIESLALLDLGSKGRASPLRSLCQPGGRERGGGARQGAQDGRGGGQYGRIHHGSLAVTGTRSESPRVDFSDAVQAARRSDSNSSM